MPGESVSRTYKLRNDGSVHIMAARFLNHLNFIAGLFPLPYNGAKACRYRLDKHLARMKSRH